MDGLTGKPDWHDALAAQCKAKPADLQALADACEAMPRQGQHEGMARGLSLLIDGTAISGPKPETWHVESLHVRLLADAGAYESAVLGLFPHDATFTGGRMADGSYTAQVILPSQAGAHSRNAKSLAMAWLAALLRAVAREMVEQRAVYGGRDKEG